MLWMLKTFKGISNRLIQIGYTLYNKNIYVYIYIYILPGFDYVLQYLISILKNLEHDEKHSKHIQYNSTLNLYIRFALVHDDVIKWKHFPRSSYWPFVRGIHRSPVNSTHKGQWRGALMFSLICVWINGWVNNREAGDLWRHRAHHGVTVMCISDARFHPCPYMCTGSYH